MSPSMIPKSQILKSTHPPLNQITRIQSLTNTSHNYLPFIPPHSPHCLLRFFTYSVVQGRQGTQVLLIFGISLSQMEMQMDFQQQFLCTELAGNNSSCVREEEEEYMRNKENIPPISSYSSGSVFRLPCPREPLQDITRLVIRSSPSVAEARARVRLGVRSSSKKCSKKKATVRLSSAGVVSSEERCQKHEMAILRKSFR